MGADQENGEISTKEQTIDEIINEVGGNANLPMILLILASISCSMNGVFVAYQIQFTGFIPKEPWTCTSGSNKCAALQLEEADFLGVDVICDNYLEYGTDYSWDIDRTTIAVDFDKICSPSQLSLLASMYYIGGTAGLFSSTWLFERFGRRKTSLVFGIILVLSSISTVFCTSYEFYMVKRLLEGAGHFVATAGKYVWLMEFVAEKYRPVYNMMTMLIWTVGYPVLVGVSYFIHTWNYIGMVLGLLMVLTYIPVALLPDSPRYLLSKGRMTECKIVLNRYARLAGKEHLKYDNVEILMGDDSDSKASKDEINNTTFLDNIIEMIKTRPFLIEVVIEGYLWFTSAMLFYFLNYGWGQFGDTPYVNYLFAGLGECIAYILLGPIVQFLGRRTAMMASLGSASLFFLIGLIPWTWSALWSLERLMNLTAIISVSIAFAVIFLYTNELSPTSHRGLMMSMCSMLARIGAFMGPFVKEILPNSRDKLIVSAVVSGVGAALCLLLPETGKIPIPETPAAVVKRRKAQNLPTC